MANHRLQIRLDPERCLELADLAEREGTSMAAIVRTAIDELLHSAAERRRAVASLRAAAALPVPDDPADLRRELDAAYDRFLG